MYPLTPVLESSESGSRTESASQGREASPSTEGDLLPAWDVGEDREADYSESFDTQPLPSTIQETSPGTMGPQTRPRTARSAGLNPSGPLNLWDRVRHESAKPATGVTCPLGSEYSPLTWDQFFDEKRFVGPGFCVYISGSTVDPSIPTLLLLHGGGHSALAWAAFVHFLRKQIPATELCVIAYDARGHGETFKVQPESDLSTATQVQDAMDVLEALFGSRERIPALALVGHSMGGAIAVQLAASGRIPQLSGLIVIDVVEGSALQALPYMKSFLASRRKEFTSLEDAISYIFCGGHVRNLMSARCSVPAQLVPVEAGDGPTPTSTSTSNKHYRWRTQLECTEIHWRDWFTGMSKRFVSVAAPKVLVLAGHDHLDRELMIAQMQGRFQVVILPQAGHSVHEDLPEQVAETVAEFLRRYRLVQSASDHALGHMKIGPITQEKLRYSS